MPNTPIDHHTLPHNVVSGQHIPGVTYFATTRIAGHSQGPWASWNLGAHCGDDSRAVRDNRAQLQSLLPGSVHWLRQVHGTEVVELKKNMRPTPMPITADAAFTRDTGCVLAVLTADCLPIVITDIHARVLGIAHAGWRGLAQGVLQQLAAHMQRYTAAQQWQAWIGPAIRQPHFEVGEDVYRSFTQQTPQDAQFFRYLRPGKWLADLAGLASVRLQRSFTGQVVVHDSLQCTYALEDQFFSYRRDRITGRLATVAWLDEPRPDVIQQP
ncbi:MAG TPA: peptidoglycan editing factor PgeF [Paenalcaligenes sp.]|nr:peptidoglycan editing factor PgeF [Paenalcaligenes sp.]